MEIAKFWAENAHNGLGYFFREICKPPVFFMTSKSLQSNFYHILKHGKKNGMKNSIAITEVIEQNSREFSILDVLISLYVRRGVIQIMNELPSRLAYTILIMVLAQDLYEQSLSSESYEEIVTAIGSNEEITDNTRDFNFDVSTQTFHEKYEYALYRYGDIDTEEEQYQEAWNEFKENFESIESICNEFELYSQHYKASALVSDVVYQVCKHINY